MVKGTKINGGIGTVPGVLAVGATVSVIVTLIGITICTSLISAERISTECADYCAIGILLLSTIAGSAVAIGKRQEKRLYTSLAVGSVYLVVLLAMTALFFGGRYQGVGVTAIVIFGGAILTVLLPGKLEMKAKAHRSKKRRR